MHYSLQQQHQQAKRLPTVVQRNAGFSVVELMVALGISGLVLAGVVQLFTSSQQSDRISQALSRMQDDGRIAMAILGDDIRMIGYQGCAPSDSSNTIEANTSPITNWTTDTLQGFAIDNAGNTITLVDSTIVGDSNSNVTTIAGSDAFTATYGSSTDIDLAADMALGTDPISLESNDLNIKTDQQLIVSNCMLATLFTVTSISDAPVVVEHSSASNASGDLGATFEQADASVHKLISNTYFVGLDTRTNRPGLYRRSYSSSTSELLIEGVENMQILYGEELTSGNIRYVDVSNNPDLGKVVAMRIALLIQSSSLVRPNVDGNAHDLLGTSINPLTSDLKMRKVFTTTVQLHNRTL